MLSGRLESLLGFSFQFLGKRGDLMNECSGPQAHPPYGDECGEICDPVVRLVIIDPFFHR